MTPFYQRLLRPETVTALEKLSTDQNDTGSTPADDLDVLAGLVVASKARRILQFGTFLGFSALVLADLARANGDGARFVTVDPNPAMNASCHKYAALAGLDWIETVDGYSTDPALLGRLRQEQWDLIFLDTTHQYGQTVDEIKAITPLCGAGTVFAFHDASQHAADALDMNHQGGVRRAMREYCLRYPKWQYYIFERPAFGQFGIGVMSKKAGP